MAIGLAIGPVLPPWAIVASGAVAGGIYLGAILCVRWKQRQLVRGQVEGRLIEATIDHLDGRSEPIVVRFFEVAPHEFRVVGHSRPIVFEPGSRLTVPLPGVEGQILIVRG